MNAIRVAVAEHPYDVHVGRGILGQIGEIVPWPENARFAALVTQHDVRAAHGDVVVEALQRSGLGVEVLDVPDGEVAKHLHVYEDLLRRMARIPLGRGDVVVALGGGVVGDLAGFAAATLNRGVPLVQVPTTLLAQVDAAIGGKTAVNLPEGKNLVGAFHQPLAVVADVETLATLDDRDLRAGLAEVVKYGFIADGDILELLDDRASDVVAAAPDLLDDLVARSVAVKARIVGADEREAGERAHLNFGHTFGHVLEALEEYTEMLHGEAVAIGMVMALKLGVRLGRTPPALEDRCLGILKALGLPTAAPALDRNLVWETMGRDKKAIGDVRFVIVEDIGRPTVVMPGRADVDAVLDELEAA